MGGDAGLGDLGRGFCVVVFDLDGVHCGEAKGGDDHGCGENDDVDAAAVMR